MTDVPVQLLVAENRAAALAYMEFQHACFGKYHPEYMQRARRYVAQCEEEAVNG